MRIAAYDLGSNSFHMIVVEAQADRTFHIVSREKEMLRLGDPVSRTGRVPPEAMDAAVGTMRRLRALATAAGAVEHVACATSAIREADNGFELIDRIQTETGIKARVISGKDEARLIFRAVQASVTIDPGPALCLDLGGGSLEVAVGDHARLLWSTSLKLGVARVAAALSGSDPPSRADLRTVRERVVEALGPVALEVAELEPSLLVVTSGTFTDLVRLALVRRTGTMPMSVNNAEVTRTELASVHDALVRATSPQRARLEALDAKRADVMPVGSQLLLTAMDVFGFERVTAGEWALREGMILEAIGHHDPAELSDDARSVRRSSVLALGRRCNWRGGHARHVATLALSLFDQTMGVHGLGERDRELLEYAALLHDIGEHVAESSHHKHTAYLIVHGGLRGFAPDEIATLAAVARYHRGSEPKPGHEHYGALVEDQRSRVVALAALLRVADGLDRGDATTVEAIDVQLVRGKVQLQVKAASDPELEVWGARRKRALFEKTFKRELVVGTGA